MQTSGGTSCKCLNKCKCSRDVWQKSTNIFPSGKQFRSINTNSTLTVLVESKLSGTAGCVHLVDLCWRSGTITDLHFGLCWYVDKHVTSCSLAWRYQVAFSSKAIERRYQRCLLCRELLAVCMGYQSQVVACRMPTWTDDLRFFICSKWVFSWCWHVTETRAHGSHV